MKTLLSIIIVLAVFALSSLIAGCAGTKMSDSWTSSSYQGPIKKAYIIGIAKNDFNRMVFEDTFENRLTSEGVEAIASYKDLLTNLEAEREEIIQRMKANDCDSVLLTRVVSTRKKNISSGQGSYQYSPGPFYGGTGVYNRPFYYNDWNSYYTHGRAQYVQPATIDLVTMTVESVLYDLKTEELIWSAQLETVLEGNIEKMIRLFVDEVSRDLKAKGLI